MRALEEEDKQSVERRLPFALALFSWGLPALWLLSVARIVLDRAVLRARDPWVLPGRFEDFFCYWGRVRLVHTAAFFTAPDSRLFGSGWGYPAPAIFIYRFFYLFDPPSASYPYRGYAVMVGLTLGIMLGMAALLVREMERRGLGRRAAIGFAACGFLLNWPLFLAIQRGNIEMLLWLPLAAAVWAFTQRRWMVAAVLIGVTASFKIYPVILLALFLRERRWKEILVGLGMAVGVTVLGLNYIGPTLRVAMSQLGLGVGGFIAEHGAHVNWRTEGFSHSLFHLLKMHLLDQPELVGRLIPRYMLGAGVVMMVVFFWRVIRLPLLNQLLVLCVSMIYLPATSYDYTLLVLLVPFSWLSLYLVSEERLGRGTEVVVAAMMVMFTVTFGPEIFLSEGAYVYSGSLKAICLGVLLVMAVLFPLREERSSGALAGFSKKSTEAGLHGGGSAVTLRKSQ